MSTQNTVENIYCLQMTESTYNLVLKLLKRDEENRVKSRERYRLNSTCSTRGPYITPPQIQVCNIYNALK